MLFEVVTSWLGKDQPELKTLLYTQMLVRMFLPTIPSVDKSIHGQDRGVLDVHRLTLTQPAAKRRHLGRVSPYPLRVVYLNKKYVSIAYGKEKRQSFHLCRLCCLWINFPLFWLLIFTRKTLVSLLILDTKLFRSYLRLPSYTISASDEL